MKSKVLLLFLFIIVLVPIFAQTSPSARVPVVGVMVFDAYGAGVSAAELSTLTNRVVSELNSWGTLNVTQGSAGAEFIVSGTVARQGNSYILTGKTMNAANRQVLNEYSETVPINNTSVFSFCAKAVERVPFPNYLAGTWQSVINMPDGPVICIIEFRADRTVRVERYDTWEHRQQNALRYEGYGTGNYYYAGYANRTITVRGQQIRIDATFNVSLKLEETLPDQTAVNQSGLSIVFNGEKTTFEIVNGMLPCGRNFDGPSVYHSATLGFTNFTKIR